MNTTSTFRRRTSLLLFALFSSASTWAGEVVAPQATATSRLKEGLELYLSALPTITKKRKVLSAEEQEKKRDKKGL